MTAGLLLAAGEGSRIGGPKALLDAGGELLVERGVRTLAEGGCSPVVVVLGAGADEVLSRASLSDAAVVVNAQWPTGMASSLVAGLRALRNTAADSALVALVDQPRVTPATVRRLVTSPMEAPAIVASYHGRPGNPVRLAASIWRSVCAGAAEDVGARAWLRAHPEQVRLEPCEDLGSDDDVDTAEDWALYLKECG